MPRALLVLLLAACAPPEATAGQPAAPPLDPGQAEAVFAGGCFWCMEKPFDAVDGVISTTSGYTGGVELGPTYADVSAHRTSHVEALRVVYDPTKVTWDALLEVFWHQVDPTQDDGQFCDKGTQYRSAVFVATPEQRAAAEASKAAVEAKLGAKVVTEIRDAAVFWVAEDYHQDFYVTNPVRYYSYRKGCGRDARLEQLWGPSVH